MTAVITWNIQYGRGVDGAVDLRRIAAMLKGMGEADAICLQEVARFVPDLGERAEADQVAVLAAAFPGYAAFFGAALDRLGGQGGRRLAFGNLVLTRLPALQVFHHALPQPADPTVKHMPRQALELVVETRGGSLRLVTTHLEYYSSRQRDAQIGRLRALHVEAAANARTPPAAGSGVFAPSPRPASAVLCGDFNCLALGDQYGAFTAPFGDGTPALRDAWTVAFPERPHEPTCGVFDTRQWPQGPHCRDFFFVTEDLAARVATVEVNGATDASDHQPLRLVLAD